MTIRNRELSQFGSFIYIDNNTKEIGITTEATPFVGIGTTNPTSKFHVIGNVIIAGIGTITTINSTDGTITNLTGTLGTITTFSSTNGTITNLTGTSATITNGNITDLYISGNAGIGTTNSTSKLHIVGDALVAGVATITNSSGTVNIGIGTTALLVHGTVRVTDTFTIGSSSIVLDGNNNQISIGTGFILNSNGISVPTGIITASEFVGNITGVAVNSISAQGLIGTPNITVGIITASSFRGYSALVGTASSTTITFVVTVASKTSNHRYFGTGSGSAYFIDGIESPFLTLLPGKTYRFTQESNTNINHQISFYYQADKTTGYTTNITTTGTPGSAGAYTEIVVTDTTPVVLHYQCINHPYMGNAAQFNSNIVDTPYQITARSGINVTGVTTSSGGFVGTLTGNVTGNTGTATSLVSARDFSIAGGFVTAPSISFDGTQNVSLAATITLNSITLGTYTSGDYIQSISGITSEITITGGTGEGSTPIIGLSSNLVLPGNLIVNGISTFTGNTTFNQINVSNINAGVMTATEYYLGGSLLVDTFLEVWTPAPIDNQYSIFRNLGNVGIGTSTNLYKLSVNGQIQSQVPQGTAPFVVQSTTNVPNLNADTVDGKHAPSGDIVGTSDSQTLTTKTLNLSNNTLTGTVAQFNTALSDDNFTTLTGTETLTNKTLTSPSIGIITNTGGTSQNIPTGIGTLISTSSTSVITTAMLVNGAVSNSQLINSTISGVALGDSLFNHIPGSYISGNNYNGSSAQTWGVNAVSSNTADTIVARDSLKRFNAGHITVENITVSAGGTFFGDGSGLTGAGSTVVDDTTTNQEFFPLFTATTSGTITASKVSTTKLNFNPSTGVLTVFDLNSTSDIKLKENIHTVQNALNVVSNLRGVSFDWKETGRGSYGVIAQELEEVLPELVSNGEIKSVNYNGIIGVLVEAIKELKNEINVLKLKL